MLALGITLRFFFLRSFALVFLYSCKESGGFFAIALRVRAHNGDHVTQYMHQTAQANSHTHKYLREQVKPSVGANAVPVAFFSAVVDECWVWPNGSLYLDGCTCGSSANPTHDPPYQVRA
jgi:hypothetical protein